MSPRRALLCACLALASVAPAAAEPLPAVPGNPADRLLALPIELPRYDRARRCVKRPSKGAKALEAWLAANSRGESWGIMRCERLSGRNFSLHAEGRAVDWHLDTRSVRDRRAADRLIRLLLASDRAGNPQALARRMGVQEIIWNCRSWWAGAERLGRYSPCFDKRGRRRKIDRTSAHRDHVHLGLNRAGARALTSFWTAGR